MSFQPRLSPNVDAAIESVYAYHLESDTHNGRIAESLGDVMHVYLETDPGIDNLDSVGRLASLINLYMDVGVVSSRIVMSMLAEVYIRCLTMFLIRKSVLDEQHWAAAYKILCRHTREVCKHSALDLCVALRELRTKPPFMSKPEFKLQVAELHTRVRA